MSLRDFFLEELSRSFFLVVKIYEKNMSKRLFCKCVETKQSLKNFTFLETKRSAASACFLVSGSLSCQPTKGQ